VTGVLSGWAHTPLEGVTGNYTIALTGAEFHTVPSPGAAAVLGLGGLPAARRRRNVGG
jgi:MYXO-CTERM domain-containing protein